MAFMKFKPIASILNFKSTIAVNDLPKDVEQYLVADEKVMLAFKSRRDIGIFTDCRILLIDKQGIRGFRRTISSVNYHSIASYSLNVRHIDSYIELVLNSGHKLLLKFSKPIPLDDMFVIYKYITHFILKEIKQ